MEGMVCCTPRQPWLAPVQHRPYQRQAGPLAEGALDEVGVVVSLFGHTALQQLAIAVAEHVRVVSPDNERGGNR
jgi:hypothetical protein